MPVLLCFVPLQNPPTSIVRHSHETGLNISENQVEWSTRFVAPSTEAGSKEVRAHARRRSLKRHSQQSNKAIRATVFCKAAAVQLPVIAVAGGNSWRNDDERAAGAWHPSKRGWGGVYVTESGTSRVCRGKRWKDVGMGGRVELVVRTLTNTQ